MARCRFAAPTLKPACAPAETGEMRGPEPCGETRDGRRRMRKYGWLILASLLWVGNAFAQTDYDGSWYVSPSVGAVFSDQNYLDSGFAVRKYVVSGKRGSVSVDQSGRR